MEGKPMISKQRVHAALEGKPVDRNPATVLYNQLYFQDHFEELTGRPQWQMQSWLYSSPQEYLATFAQMIVQTPFEFLQPEFAPTHEARASVEFVTIDGEHYRRDRRDGSLQLIDSGSGHARDYLANETQYVFDRRDADNTIKIVKAEKRLRQGCNDYIDQVVSAFGKDHFILSGGVIGTLYSSGDYVGQTNALAMLIEQPKLMDYIFQKITEQNIETIRTLAAAGGDGIYIDDATATSDMISVAAYERFSLPYMQMMVQEIHRLGQKAIVIYFGGVSDRLEQIVATGADGLLMETSMKNFTNDISAIASQIGQRITLFGNIDPVAVLQDASDANLQAEMERQARAGQKCRGFIMSTGSPITPGTPISRVRKFLQLAGVEL
jgi:Uroporphyrinogen decarboxylase (URO-D)